ncbi:MAG: DUF1800 domain-containing protein, partial [Acidimicrobiales bacterium]
MGDEAGDARPRRREVVVGAANAAVLVAGLGTAAARVLTRRTPSHALTRGAGPAVEALVPAPATGPAAATTPAPASAPVVPAAGPSADRGHLAGEALVLHVARRASFGPTPELLAELRAAGPQAWLDQQLRPAEMPDHALDAVLAGFPSLHRSSVELDADGMDPGAAARDLSHATLLRAVHSRRQLYEVTVDFWTNHFNVATGSRRLAAYKVVDDREVIRPHALGRFADLLLASARSPAMLDYLDNASSKRDAPNENYARELLELHTVGVDAGYSEAEVKAVARVFTGGSIDRASGLFTFLPGRHDAGPAEALGWSTAGHAGPGGQADGESLLAHLARHPSTADRLARKLATRFIGDEPAAAAVDTVARAYLDADTDIAATLRALFGTDAFLRGGEPKLRRPFELLAAALRATAAQIDPRPDGQASVLLDRHLTGMHQPLFGCPTPNGYPDTAAAWLGAGAL